VVQCFIVCRSVLQCGAVFHSVFGKESLVRCAWLSLGVCVVQCGAVFRSVLDRCAVIVVQCVQCNTLCEFCRAVVVVMIPRSVLQCVAVCCSVV